MRYRHGVVVATLVACGSSGTFVQDAGPDSFGIKHFDAAVFDGAPSPFGDSSTVEVAPPPACGEADVSLFTPTWQQAWVPPAPFGGSACTDNQIYDYYVTCGFANVLDPSTCATKLNQPNSLDCFTCLAPTSTAVGPFKAATDVCGRPLSLNVGGCIANVLGTTCASAWMTANQCSQIACSTCSCGGGEDFPDSKDPCVASGGSGCDAERANAACALSSTDPTVKACLAAVDPSGNAILAFAKLFCGGAPPSDAGTD